MSYVLSVLTDSPLGLWMLDDTAPFQDYSGYNPNGVMNAGTPTTSVALCAGTAFSQVFSNSNNAKFDSSVYVPGYESQPFSLEVSFRVINEGAGAAQKVLSSSSNYDGITVSGTVITFSTKYVTNGTAAVSYDIQSKRNVHVVGVHTRDKNQLYVDGELVGEIAITDLQKADTYVTGDGKLYMGVCTGSQQIAANGVAIYGVGLSDSQIKNHFNAARRTTVIETVAPTFAGVRYPLSANLGDLFARYLLTTESDWKLGTLTNATIMNNQIVPQLAAGVSVAGNWQIGLPLDASQKTNVNGVSMTWAGSGVTVQASLDGSTWETAVQGKKLALITSGFNPTDDVLFIKASFAGGITDDPSYLDNLYILGFTTGVMPTIGGRVITLTDPASPMSDYQPIELRDDWGLLLTGGTVSISDDTTTDPVAMYSMNVWLKKTTSTTPTFSVTGATAYKNGAAGGTLNQGEWAMYTLTKSTALTAPITISGSAQIGQIELFDHQLSAQEVADLYAASVGVLKTTAADSDGITITNPNPSTKLYDYTWAITGAG